MLVDIFLCLGQQGMPFIAFILFLSRFFSDPCVVPNPPPKPHLCRCWFYDCTPRPPPPAYGKYHSHALRVSYRRLEVGDDTDLVTKPQEGIFGLGPTCPFAAAKPFSTVWGCFGCAYLLCTLVLCLLVRSWHYPPLEVVSKVFETECPFAPALWMGD